MNIIKTCYKSLCITLSLAIIVYFITAVMIFAVGGLDYGKNTIRHIMGF